MIMENTMIDSKILSVLLADRANRDFAELFRNR